MQKNIKKGFTLAETIMTLFIVGLVVTAAIPVFTQKQTINNAEVNSPWKNCNDTTQTGLCGISAQSSGSPHDMNVPIYIGNDEARPLVSLYSSSAFADLPKFYDLTVDTGILNDSIYDIFTSDIRNVKVGNHYFTEIGSSMYISENDKDNLPHGDNSILIGNVEPKKPSNFNHNIFIGKDNTVANDIEQTIVFGNSNLTSASVKKSLVFGNNNKVYQSYSTVVGNNMKVNSSPATVIASSDTSIDVNNASVHDTLLIGDAYIHGNKDDGITISGDLEVTGNFIIATPPAVPSDIRLKNIKGSYQKGLNEILQINPVIFNYKNENPNSKHAGVIAQDVQKVFPEAVVKMPNGYYGIDDSPMFFAMLNAMKEVNQKTNIEKQRQIKLQSELDEITAEIDSLTACKADNFFEKIRCFLLDIKNYAKTLIAREVKYEKV